MKTVRCVLFQTIDGENKHWQVILPAGNSVVFHDLAAAVDYLKRVLDDDARVDDLLEKKGFLPCNDPA